MKRTQQKCIVCKAIQDKWRTRCVICGAMFLPERPEDKQELVERLRELLGI